MDEPSSSSSESSFSSSGEKKPEVRRPLLGTDNLLGKHRLAAAVAHLDHQIKILQEELVELETIGASSITCKEVISGIGSVPDGLLPLTKGPADVAWDQWFRGAHSCRSHKRWL